VGSKISPGNKIEKAQFVVKKLLLEDLEDFVNFRIAREERFAGTHLREDAAHAPHVNTSRILFPTQQNFRRTIPESDDLDAKKGDALAATLNYRDILKCHS